MPSAELSALQLSCFLMNLLMWIWIDEQEIIITSLMQIWQITFTGLVLLWHWKHNRCVYFFIVLYIYFIYIYIYLQISRKVETVNFYSAAYLLIQSERCMNLSLTVTYCKPFLIKWIFTRGKKLTNCQPGQYQVTAVVINKKNIFGTTLLFNSDRLELCMKARDCVRYDTTEVRLRLNRFYYACHCYYRENQA